MNTLVRPASSSRGKRVVPSLARPSNVQGGQSGCIVLVWAANSRDEDADEEYPIYSSYDTDKSNMSAARGGDDAIVLIGIHRENAFNNTANAYYTTGLDMLSPSDESLPSYISTDEIYIEPGVTEGDITTTLTLEDFQSWYTLGKNALGHTPEAVYLLFDNDLNTSYAMFEEYSTGPWIINANMFSHGDADDCVYSDQREDFTSWLEGKSITVNEYDEVFGNTSRSSHYPSLDPIYIFEQDWPNAVYEALTDFYS